VNRATSINSLRSVISGVETPPVKYTSKHGTFKYENPVLQGNEGEDPDLNFKMPQFPHRKSINTLENKLRQKEGRYWAESS
jgi:hypothetical protein